MLKLSQNEITALIFRKSDCVFCVFQGYFQKHFMFGECKLILQRTRDYYRFY